MAKDSVCRVSFSSDVLKLSHLYLSRLRFIDYPSFSSEALQIFRHFSGVRFIDCQGVTNR
jgi:hypothetical protein